MAAWWKLLSCPAVISMWAYSSTPNSRAAPTAHIPCSRALSLLRSSTSRSTPSRTISRWQIDRHPDTINTTRHRTCNWPGALFFVLRQHRTIPALRLKHRSGSCGTASALPKCSIMSGCGTRIVLRGQKAPRTLRPLPLLRFAVSATGGAHLCSIQYYLRFWLGICRTSLAVSALRIMRYCLIFCVDYAGTKNRFSGFCLFFLFCLPLSRWLPPSRSRSAAPAAPQRGAGSCC